MITMYSLILFSLLPLIRAEIVAPGIDRTISAGAKSRTVNYLYGDEDMVIVNEVVDEMEKLDELKPRVNLNEELPALPAEDVKCLMSVDKYCSKDMSEMKSKL